MCSLTEREKRLVKNALSEMIDNGLPFTGYDVKKKTEELAKQADCYLSRRLGHPDDISPYCRELLNKGWRGFEGWASMKHPDCTMKIRPLIYFKLDPSRIKGLKKLIEKISPSV